MRNDYKAAQPDTEAALALVDVKSPVALHASYVKAVCLYKKGDYGGAEAVTRRALNSGAQQMPRTRMLNDLTVLQAGLEQRLRPAKQATVQQEVSK